MLGVMRGMIVAACALALSGCSTLTSWQASITGAATTANTNAAALAKLALSDLQAAQADAQANNDTAASQCYAALIPLAQARSNATTNTPGAVTTFQIARDATRQLEGQGSVALACAALNASVKSDVLNLGGLLGLGL